jgi:hypothetical protein
VWGEGSPHCAALDAAGAAWTMTGRGSRDPSGSLPRAAGLSCFRSLPTAVATIGSVSACTSHL